MKITEKNIRFIAVYFLLAAGLAVCTAYAGEMKELELNDGTVITGEIVSLDDGVSTVKSESLGTIKLAESRVRTIRVKGSTKDSDSADTNAQAQALQQKMMNDTEVMKAVNSGDVAALMANPQFLKLMNNRTVQEITNKVSK